ncbi:MAG: hypothetical protein KAU20_03400 [Nanoarchaeota archaeon]|nr:hypothetical protein [Nanoarchaeota archaeon]
MDNQEIRLKILEKLYGYAIENARGYITKEVLLNDLGIDESSLNFNIKYLEDKSLVKLEKFLGGGFLAQITVYGIDSVEN